MNLKGYLVKGLLCLGLFVSVVSCSSDDNNGGGSEVLKMTPKEAKVFVEQSLGNFTTCVEKYESGMFGNFLYDYYINEDRKQNNKPPYNWITPANGKSEWVNDVIEQWTKQYGYFVEGDRPFNLAGRAGVYTWDKNTHKFTKEAKGDAFVLIFPSDRSESDLDFKLEVKKYVDSWASFEGEKTYYPMSLDFAFYKKNEKILGAVADDIKFDVKDNFSMPISGNVVIYTNPVTHKINLTRETPTVFNVSEVFSQEGGCETSIKAKVHFTNSDYGNFTNLKKDVDFADLEVSHNDMSIKFNINMKEFQKANKDFEKLTENEFNNVVKVELFKGNRKAGDLMLYNLFKEESKQNIMLILSDGSVQDLMQSFKDEVEKLKEVVKRFLD